METMNTNSAADFLRSHIIFGSIPKIEEQTTEQPKETKIMTTEATNTIVPTPDHTVNTPIMTTESNNSNTVSTAEQPTITDLIVTLACGRGSRIVSSLVKINDYIVIGLIHKADHARYNLSRNIARRIFENPTDRAIEEVYNTLTESAQSIIDAVNNLKQINKPTIRGGVVYDACVQYAVSTVRGDILRSNRVVSALEGCALRMCVSRDTAGTIIMSEALDKALNKVYAAVRSQAKTNGVDIGGKSNTATKTATKTAILAELVRIKTEDSYQFDIIIGEVRPLSGQ